MNKAQARHSKSMARKIRMHADSLSRSMAAIEREDLSNVPLDTVKSLFGEVEGYCTNIQSVLSDMLSELDEQ